MPTVPPAPGSFNGYDENYLGSPRTRSVPLPDELSAVGVPLAFADEEPPKDDDLAGAMAEMVDDAIVQGADEILGAEIDAATLELARHFPEEDHLVITRSFSARAYRGKIEREVTYAAWIGDAIAVGITPEDAARKVARMVNGDGGQTTPPGTRVAAQ